MYIKKSSVIAAVLIVCAGAFLDLALHTVWIGMASAALSAAVVVWRLESTERLAVLGTVFALLCFLPYALTHPRAARRIWREIGEDEEIAEDRRTCEGSAQGRRGVSRGEI